jgi:hypothetical protein
MKFIELLMTYAASFISLFKFKHNFHRETILVKNQQRLDTPRTLPQNKEEAYISLSKYFENHAFLLFTLKKQLFNKELH